MNKDKDKYKHNHINRPRSTDVGLKRCFMTKEMHSRLEMLRFVISPDKTVVFDVDEKLAGHGMWLTADKGLLKTACEKRIFYKAAKGTVKIPENLTEQVENIMKQRCLNLLSLCRKAGLLVFGYEAVKKTIAQQQVITAFEAIDSSERGQNKIYKSDELFNIFKIFSRSEMGKVAGLDEIVHLVLLKGKLSEKVIALAHKITLFQKETTERTNNDRR